MKSLYLLSALLFTACGSAGNGASTAANAIASNVPLTCAQAGIKSSWDVVNPRAGFDWVSDAANGCTMTSGWGYFFTLTNVSASGFTLDRPTKATTTCTFTRWGKDGDWDINGVEQNASPGYRTHYLSVTCADGYNFTALSHDSTLID